MQPSDCFHRGYVTSVLTLLVLSAAVLPEAALAQKPGKLSTPTIACGQTTPVSTELLFVAGSPTGAPAGFSLQWMSLDDWTNNGNTWLLSDDPNLCKGSFSGNAFGHAYSLRANDGTTVNVGDILFDNPGASSNCDVPLVCNTRYIFRAFSHATRTHMRSAFTSNLVCTTRPCTSGGNCTRTPGYWKHHGPAPCQVGAATTNVWPVTTLSLGSPGTSYTDLELCSILQYPAGGNGLVLLAHVLIAAELNIANGADGTAVAPVIAAAHGLIGALVIPPVGSGSLDRSLTLGLALTLDNYNNGLIGPGHCDL